MTAKCRGGQVASCTGAGMEKLEYVYDGKDQLRRVTRKLAGVVTGSEEYWYGMAGNRVSILKRDAAGTKTEMIWFIGDTQAHYDASGAVTHVYSNISLGTPVARVDRTADSVTTTEYQFHGLASSTLATVASNGMINTSFRYSPWGDVVESTNAGGASNGTAVHRQRHNDKYVDEVSNLTYYGARYYDRLLIGWTQADPLYLRVPDGARRSSPRRASLYAYTLQNPLRYLDPDGLDSNNVGFNNFASRCGAGSVCGAGAGIESRWGISGETSTTALRSMIGLGIAKKRSHRRPIDFLRPEITHMSPSFQNNSEDSDTDSITWPKFERKETRFGDTVLLGAILFAFCEPCAVLYFAGAAGASTEGEAMVAAGCSGAACSKSPKPMPGVPTVGMMGRLLTRSESAEFAAFGLRARRLGMVENPSRTGSWGQYQGGRFREVVRIDVGERGKPGFRGKTHVHVDGGAEHLPSTVRLPGE
jgi:RHS repeat-associated protein